MARLIKEALPKWASLPEGFTVWPSSKVVDRTRLIPQIVRVTKPQIMQNVVGGRSLFLRNTWGINRVPWLCPRVAPVLGSVDQQGKQGGKRRPLQFCMGAGYNVCLSLFGPVKFIALT